MDSKLISHITLQDDEYASVISDDMDFDTIKSISEEKQIVGIFGSPSIGKSTLMSGKAERTVDLGLHVVIVSPTINLNYMLNEGLNGAGAMNFDGYKYKNLGKQLVVTTPDGLGNLVKEFEEKGIFFELHVDEIHERIDSSKTRNLAYKNVDKAITSKNCTVAFLYTGTPDSVKNFYDFTKVYHIHKKGKRIEKNPKVITIESVTETAIKDCIEYAYVKHRAEDGQVFIFLNDKVKHNYVEKNLDLDIFNFNTIDKSKVLLISADTRKNDNIKEMIKNKHIPLEYQIILVTSSASAGIEFFLDKKATVMVFCDNYTFNINQEVQSTIRVRSDLYELLFVKPQYKNETDKSEYIEYDKFFNMKINKYTELLKRKIQFWNNIKKEEYMKMDCSEFSKELLAKVICFTDMEHGALEEKPVKNEGCSVALVYNADEDVLEIDEALLHKYIWDEYARAILKNTNNFIECMKKQCTQFDFENQKFDVLRYEELFSKDFMMEAIMEVIKIEDVSSTENIEKEQDKKHKELLIKELRENLERYELPVKEKIKLILKNDEHLPSKTIHKDLYNTIDVLENMDKTFKALKELLLKTPSHKSREQYYTEYLQGTTPYRMKKYKEHEIFKIRMYSAYSLIDKNDLEEIKKEPVAIKELVYIMLYLRKKDGTYRDVRITKDIRKKLYVHLQTRGLYLNKEFTDDIDDKMFELLNKIYNLTEVKRENNKKSKLDKVYRITSLKIKYNKQQMN